MQYIPLRRTFQTLDPTRSVSEFRHRYGGLGDQTWDELLLLRRVMVVGAAGAGKTVEMDAQCKRLLALGKSAFFVTVSSVSRSGFRDSLSGGDAARFDGWKACSEPAYFFLDSKDEAVNAGESLTAALRKLGNELGATLAQAHIFISTRPSDLAPDIDMRNLREFCPFVGAYRLDETPDDVLLSVTVSEPNNSHAARLNRLTQNGDFRLVQLTPLSASDQRLYLEGKHPQSADSLNRFLSALTYSGLAPLAAYPRDLSVFAAYWLEHGCLGEISVMLDAYCEQLIREVREDVATSHSLPVSDVRAAVERLAAACVLGGKDGVLSLAEQEVAASGVVNTSFACAELWPQLQPRDHRSILSRGIFDSLVVGQLRLRRDVKDYLAGQWLLRAFHRNGARRKLKKYLLASHGDRYVVLHSRASVTMMLAMRDEMLFGEVLRRNPMLFLSETFVAGFSESARVRALEACVIRLMQGAELPGPRWDTDTDSIILRAFAFPDALKKLKMQWADHADTNESVRVLLLWILCEAKEHDCADEALNAALNPGCGERTQRLAIQALQVANNGPAIERFFEALLSDVAQVRFSGALVKHAIDWLLPEHLSHAQFLALAPRLAQQMEDDRFSSFGFANSWAERIALDDAGMQLLLACVERIGTLPLDAEQSYEPPWPESKVFFAFASSLALRWFEAIEKQPPSQEKISLLLTCAAKLLCLNTQHSSSDADHEKILQLINATPAWKHAVYWQVVDAVKLNDAVLAETDVNFFIDMLPQSRIIWLPTDAPHLFERMQNVAHQGDRKIALKLLFWYHAQSGQSTENVEQIRAALIGAPLLQSLLTEWTKPHPPSEEMLAHQRRTETWRAREVEKKSLEQNTLLTLRSRLESAVEISITDLSALWKWLCVRAQRVEHNNASPQMVKQWPALVYAFGDHAARLAAAAFRSHWRECTIPEAAIDGRSGDSFVTTQVALFGLELEHAAMAHTGGLSLTSDEASRAIECARGEYEMPAWLEGVVTQHRELARCELGAYVQTRLADANEHYQPIQDLRYRLPTVRDLLAPDLFQWLRTNQRAPDDALDSLLLVLSAAHSVDKAELSHFFADQSNDQPAARLLYFKRLLWLDAIRAVQQAERWSTAGENNPLLNEEWLASLSPGFVDQPKLGFLSGTSDAQKRDAHVAVLQWMLTAVNPMHDQQHPGGTPSQREYAQQSRNSFLANLGEFPGMATVAVIRTLKQNPTTSSLHRWMDRMIEARLLQDAEPSALTARQVNEIEAHAESTPKNGQELLDLAIERLRDVQHYVRDDPFSIRTLLLKADSEAEFQRWLAHELHLRACGRYTVIREAHVVDEKEPDILLKAPNGISVAIEMKLAYKKHWSVAKLEAGLSTQLVGQYLRHDTCRHGVYVLIRQQRQAWIVAGTRLSFGQLVDRLSQQANRIETNSMHGVVVKVLSTL